MLDYLYSLVRFVLGLILFLIIFFFGCRISQYRQRQKHVKKHGKNIKVITLVHPNCLDFGGGEKVLWMIINALTTLDTNSLSSTYKINIVTSHLQRSMLQEFFDVDNPVSKLGSHKDLLKKINERFAINLRTGSELIKAIEFVECQSSKFFAPLPILTMVFQIIPQLIFAIEICMRTYLGDVVLDTTGLPFTYAIFGFFANVPNLCAYVHYPFISEDMVEDVKQGVDGVHSRGALAKNELFRKVKLFYYSVILKFYKFNCKYLKFMFCNSTWTYSHMKSIAPQVANQILYPPCAVDVYKTTDSSSTANKENAILSFAQFRPEKNHRLQINILSAVRKQLPNFDVKLWLIGGVRNEEDQNLFNELKDYVQSLGLSGSVEFLSNLTTAEVKLKFQTAKVGIHTMRDEHFGISVIEMMSSGLVTVAHNSAGPQKDIIGSSKKPVGYLCEDEKDYVEKIVDAFKNYETLQPNIHSNCNDWVGKFSDEKFKDNFIALCKDHKILI